MIKTGIFGGSFNPIHKGHILLAKHLLKALALNEVWFVVSPQNPLKAQKHLVSDDIRFRWVEKALENESQLVACNAEMNLPKPSYMWNTLMFLQKKYPERTFTLLIGADNWACFNQWFNAKNIINSFHIAVYPRTGYTLNTASMPNNVQAIDAPLFNISSTMIREKIANNLPIEAYVPNAIIENVMQTYSHKNINKYFFYNPKTNNL